MHVLIVEDDRGITSFLEKGLVAEGYAVTVAGTPDEAHFALGAADAPADLVLLDLGLPGGEGGDVLTWMRGRGIFTPVIILTAHDEVEHKVHTLNAGASDYVTKPFSFDELLARVRATLRTAEQKRSSEIVVGDLRLDLLTKVASRSGQRIELAPREWALLELFMRHPHQVLSRAQILSAIWDQTFETDSNVVDVYVGYLRRKLNRSDLEPLLVTVRGAGYRFADQASAAEPDHPLSDVGEPTAD